MKNTSRAGFTIVELVIVIAVIAVLAAVLIPTFSGITDKANDSKALQEAKNACGAQEAASSNLPYKTKKTIAQKEQLSFMVRVTRLELAAS